MKSWMSLMVPSLLLTLDCLKSSSQPVEEWAANIDAEGMITEEFGLGNLFSVSIVLLQVLYETHRPRHMTLFEPERVRVYSS